MDWRPRPSEFQENPQGTPGIDGGAVGSSVAVGLVLGLIWEFFMIFTEIRLGFIPPVWEIAVGIVGFAGFASLVVAVFLLAGAAIYSTNKIARAPDSYDARQVSARAKHRAATYVVGFAGMAIFGGVIMWLASITGPEYEAFNGFSRFTAFVGVLLLIGSLLYVRRDPEKLT